MKHTISSLVLVILISVTFASSGGFGEVAGYLTYNAFIPTPQTDTWTLVNSYNTFLPFYISLPNMTNVSITTSVMNGTMKPNSYFSINVTVLSHTTETEMGNIVAYTGSRNNTNGSNGVQIRLAAIKLMTIIGTTPNSIQTTTAQTTVSNTTQTTIPVQEAQPTSSVVTTMPATNVQPTSAQTTKSESASSNVVIPAIGVVIAVIFGIAIGMILTKKAVENEKK